MKIRYKTDHGLAILSVPNDFPVDADAARDAASSLDRMATEADAGSARIDWHNSEGERVGSMKWSPDNDPEK